VLHRLPELLLPLVSKLHLVGSLSPHLLGHAVFDGGLNHLQNGGVHHLPKK